jgi:hypothetical protein
MSTSGDTTSIAGVQNRAGQRPGVSYASGRAWLLRGNRKVLVEEDLLGEIISQVKPSSLKAPNLYRTSVIHRQSAFAVETAHNCDDLGRNFQKKLVVYGLCVGVALKYVRNFPSSNNLKKSTQKCAVGQIKPTLR